MTSASRPLVLAMAATVIAVAVIVLVRPGEDGPIDLASSPPTIFATQPFSIGETYTLGNTFIPPELARPITITAVEVVHASGLDLLGTVAFDPQGESIGAVPGWPPDRPDMALRDPFAEGVAWPDDVQPLIGVRVRQLPAGLRGVTVRWVDGDGVAGERTFDFAVLTCMPEPCDVDRSGAELLRQLGLQQ